MAFGTLEGATGQGLMSIELLQQRTLKWEIDRLNDLAFDSVDCRLRAQHLGITNAESSI